MMLMNFSRKLRLNYNLDYWLRSSNKISSDAVFLNNITLIGFFSRISGLAESARHIAANLKEDGFIVHEIDYEDVLNNKHNRSQMPTTYLIHVNPPEFARVLSLLKIKSDDYVIGYWMWELETIPSFWNKTFSYVHEIWTASQFCANAFIKNDKNKPIKVYKPRFSFPTKTYPKRDIFTVIYMFDFNSSIERKNPIAAIKAFKLAFGGSENHCLEIKTSNASRYKKEFQKLIDETKENKNIRIFDKKFTPEERDEFIVSSHCLLSLHRSEGFGLTLMEAISHGVPVVATDYSATSEFLNKSNGYPVGYKMIPVKDKSFAYHDSRCEWAEADLQNAVIELKKVYEVYSEKK